MSLHYDIFETRFGWVGVLASSDGLRRTTLPQPSPDECVALLGNELEQAELSPERFEVLKDKIVRYLEGDLVSFEEVSIDVEDATPFLKAAWAACRSIPKVEDATPFLKAAWAACRSIPKGETRTYKWVASQAGKPQAPRAAGQAMARNRLPLIVPCHRVIASDGSLRGFGKGTTQLGLKSRLLNLEGNRDRLA
jgi:methylated-DNA-[protein]-cysteine S-methyltransferase